MFATRCGMKVQTIIKGRRGFVLRVCWAFCLLLALVGTAQAATPQIVSGGGANCLLRQDGRVSCWGFDGNGQASPPPGPFEQISLGSSSGCGLRANGQVECWGGQDVSGPGGFLDVPAGTYTQVDAGDYFHCALRDDQKIVCWGTQIGGVNIPFAEDTDHFSKVSTGWSSVCGIRTNGALACWSWAPLSIPEGSYTEVSAPNSNSVACAVRSDGQVVCWGYDLYGQTTPPTGNFVSVGVGLYHACGLQSDGTIACWGYFGNQDYRQYFPPPGQYTSLGVDTHHNCALRVDGVTVCWGIDGAGSAPKLAIEPKIVPAAVVGVPYSAVLSMVDKGSIYTFDAYSPVDPILSVTAGQLPPGFNLSAAGQLEGTASTTGLWPVTVLAQDDNGYEVERDLAFTAVLPGEDVTPPEIAPVVSGLNEQGDWYRSNVTVEWQVNDPESGATSRVGCETAMVDQDTSRTGTSFTCIARSTGGVASETVELRRDATPPAVEITSVEPLPYYGEGYFRFHFTATDAVSTVAFAECRIDDGYFAFCDSFNYETVGYENVGPLSAGPHKFYVRAADNAGNYSDPVTYELNPAPADTTPPVIVPNVSGTAGNNGWYLGNVSITWSVSDSESPISSSTGCDDTVLATDTSGATYTCTATSAGGTSQQAVNVKRDAGPPDTAISSGPADPSTTGSAQFVFGGTDSLSGIAGLACSLDAAAFTSCLSPLAMAGLPNGAHTMAVRAIDAAGNVDATPATHAWTIQTPADVIAPVANPVPTKPANQFGWYRANASVNWNWSDAGTGINTAQCTAQTTSFGEGLITLSATCNDMAGNVGTASFQIRVDKTPPTISPFVPSQILLNGAATASAGARDSLSGIDTQGCDPIRTNVVGTYSSNCTATDRAGNKAASIKVFYEVLYGMSTYNPPIANPPTANLIRRTDGIPFRFRLVDANGVAVSTFKDSELKLYGFEVARSTCDAGPQQTLTQFLDNGGKLRYLGNGNYEVGIGAKNLKVSSCYYLYLGSPVDSKLALFRVY